MDSSWNNGVRRAGRWLATGLCAALTLTILFMAFAVFLQALAVLVLALLSAVLLLPRPLKWYATQYAEAVDVFLNTLLSSSRAGSSAENPERNREASPSAGT